MTSEEFSSSSCHEHVMMETEDSETETTAVPAKRARTDLSEQMTILMSFTRMTTEERIQLLEALVTQCSHSEQVRLESLLWPHLKRDFLVLLPDELALNVLRHLSPQDLLTCARVSRTWRRLSEDWSLWQRHGGKEQLLARQRRRCNWCRGVSGHPPMVLRAHTDHVITCLEMIGDLVVSASDDSTISVWNARTGQLERTLTGHVGGVWSTAVVEGYLVSGSTDRCVRVWDVYSGECIHNLQGHVSTVRCLAGRAQHVASGSRDTTVRVWDVTQGECSRLLAGHRAAVRCVSWFSYSLLVSGSYDATVRVWDVWNEQALHVLQEHVNRVYTVVTTDSLVISGSLDTTIRVWKPDTGERHATLLGHQSLTSGMEVRGSRLVSGNADATVRVWDLDTGRCLHILAGEHRHQSAVTCVQLTEEHIISASDDGTVKLWDLQSGRFIRDLVRLGSCGGQGGVVWRILVTEGRLVCAAGSRNGVEDTKLVVCDFEPSRVTSIDGHSCAASSEWQTLATLPTDPPRPVLPVAQAVAAAAGMAAGPRVPLPVVPAVPLHPVGLPLPPVAPVPHMVEAFANLPDNEQVPVAAAAVVVDEEED